MANAPLYAVINRDLMSQITSGKLKPGHQLESESRLATRYGVSRMTVRQALGQLELEWRHLAVKLAARSPVDAERWRRAAPTPHPLFHVVPGGVASWERAA